MGSKRPEISCYSAVFLLTISSPDVQCYPTYLFTGVRVLCVHTLACHPGALVYTAACSGRVDVSPVCMWYVYTAPFCVLFHWYGLISLQVDANEGSPGGG